MREIKHRMWKQFVDTLNDSGKIIFFIGFRCVIKVFFLYILWCSFRRVLVLCDAVLCEIKTHVCIMMLTLLMTEQVKELVSDVLYERYDRLLLQNTLDTMADLVYCPRPQCRCAVLIDGSMATCPSCDYVFCIYCKMTYHGLSSCRILTGTISPTA